MTNTYLEFLLREFGGSPRTRAALLAGTGIDRIDPGGEITVGQQLRVLQNLGSRAASDWALRLASRYAVAGSGPVGFAALSAPSLSASLAVVERFARVRVPYARGRLRSRMEGSRFVLAFEVSAPATSFERTALSEALMVSLQTLVELIIGRPAREAGFAFAYARPPHADRYESYFHGRIRFGAATTALSIPAHWLAVASPTADPIMHETSLRQLELLERRLDSQVHIVARVQQILAASGDAGLTLAEAAARLDVSPRTLNRKLQEQCATYREILDAHRRERAQALLGDPHIDLAEVGVRLGYVDPANFGRACRRWFGAAPRSQRLRILSHGRAHGGPRTNPVAR